MTKISISDLIYAVDSILRFSLGTPVCKIKVNFHTKYLLFLFLSICLSLERDISQGKFLNVLSLSFYSYEIILKSESLILLKLDKLMVAIRKKSTPGDHTSSSKYSICKLSLARCFCAFISDYESNLNIFLFTFKCFFLNTPNFFICIICNNDYIL